MRGEGIGREHARLVSHCRGAVDCVEQTGGDARPAGAREIRREALDAVGLVGLVTAVDDELLQEFLDGLERAPLREPSVPRVVHEIIDCSFDITACCFNQISGLCTR
jgi:hypothetical protein